MDNIKTIPTKELVNSIREKSSQEEINIIVFEIATRLYVPFNGHTSFDELLTNLGYRQLTHIENKSGRRM
jgi:hypothetical protein